MTGLSADRLECVLAAAGRLASCQDLPALRAEVLETIRSLVDCDSASYNEISRTAPAIVITNPDEASIGDNTAFFDSLAWQNPLIAYSAAHGPAPGMRFSDLLTRRDLKRLEVYQLVYKPRGVEYQLATAINPPGTAVIGVALNRRRRDFSDDEVAMLDLLRPFLQASHRRLSELAHLELMLAALDAGESTRAVLLVDDGGTILKATPTAQRLLDTHVPAPLRAPLRQWLAAATTKRGSDSLVFACRGGLVRARMLPAAGEELQVITLETVREAALRLGAQALGLSRRECQVIELAGSGAPTADIADRLGISTRTADKHLERVYRKLDANSRADALRRILHAAGGPTLPPS
ncbi:MAG TPA: helix-turn-helix transcriptional regulator [Solirubrobacteraceae bacterium]|jgi:DNA-binding CsgD family transcriptional regulator|nr:helix-turn-helix transcriptional regulator [Solirubrobacteraceae bacterium]